MDGNSSQGILIACEAKWCRECRINLLFCIRIILNKIRDWFSEYREICFELYWPVINRNPFVLSIFNTPKKINMAFTWVCPKAVQ